MHLINAIVQSPSLQLKVTQLVQIFPACYRTRRFIAVFIKSQPPVPTLSQMNLGHTLTYYFLEIYFNIILPSRHRSSNKSPLLKFFEQHFVHIAHLSSASSRQKRVNSLYGTHSTYAFI